MLPAFEFKLFGQYKGHKVEMPVVDMAIADFRNDIGDMSPAFRLIAEDLTEDTMQRFESEGGRGTVSWQQLAPSTVRQRGSAHPILVRDGMLRGSFEKGGAGHVEDVSEKTLLWGSSINYALFQQTGTDAGYQQDRLPPESAGARASRRRAEGSGQGLFSFARGRGMPRRKIIAVDEDLKVKMASTLRARIVQVARQYGFGTERGIGPGLARRIGQNWLRSK